MNWNIPINKQFCNLNHPDFDPQSYSDWIPYEIDQKFQENQKLDPYNSYCNWGIHHPPIDSQFYEYNFQKNLINGNTKALWVLSIFTSHKWVFVVW